MMVTKTPINIKRIRKTTGSIRPNKSFSTPRSFSLRRPNISQSIFQIQKDLLEQINDPESEYNGCPEVKKKILFETLDKIILLNTGYEKQLERAKDLFHVSDASQRVQERQPQLNVLSEAKEQYNSTKKAHLAMKRKIKEHQERILVLQEEIKTTKIEIQKMRNHIKYGSVRFSQAVAIEEKLDFLSKEHQSIFTEPPQDETTQSIIDSNKNLEKEISKLKYHLKLCTQMTKRLKFSDQARTKQSILLTQTTDQDSDSSSSLIN